MNRKIKERVINESNYIISSGDTIRQVAKIFNVSKSTVHKDLSDRLLILDKDLYNKVDKLLKYHIEIRHIRGGESTRLKFLKN